MAADTFDKRAKMEFEFMVSHDLLFEDRSDGSPWKQYEYYPKTKDDEKRINSFLGQDKDWQDIQRHLVDNSHPSINYVPLYDAKRNTVYHLNDQTEREINPDESTQRHGRKVPAIPDSEPRDSEHQAAVREVMGRLAPVDGQFGHAGYHEWMTRSLARRVPLLKSLNSNIPDYGHLCRECLHVLSHSLILYHLILMGSIDAYHDRAGITRSYNVKRRYFGPKTEIFAHHGSVRALNASAMEGCHLCCQITDLFGAETLQSKEDSHISYVLDMHSKILDLEPAARFGVPGLAKSLDIHSVSDSHQDWVLRKGPSTLKYPRTNIPEVIEEARQWLAECLENHTERCISQAQFVPTRLIKVTASHGSPLSTKLVLGKDLPDGTQYLTLSHCWGGLEMTTLTTDNLDQFQAQIPVDSLPKTFQEAFQTTIWLGHTYIWIDSLCILQDSSQDWEKEAATMGRVYQNSICTLAATGAENGTQGLFFDRSPLVFTECPLFRDRVRDKKPVDFFVGSDTPIPTPLTSRAWVVQEQALSIRTIKFGRDKLSWACRTTTCSEGPNGRDLSEENHAREFTDILLGTTTRVRIMDLIQGEIGPFNFKWDELVKHYTSCNLTKATDRWPAFQGLAVEVAKAQRRSLVHGLWSEDLCHQLLWAVLKPTEKPCDLGKPSWSWLNTTTGVEFPFMKEHMPTAAEVCLWVPPSSKSDAGNRLEDAKLVSVNNKVHKTKRSQPTTGPEMYHGEASMPIQQISSTSSIQSVNTLRITAFITPCVSKPLEQGNSSYRVQLIDCTRHVVEAEWYPDSKPTGLAFLWALHVADPDSECSSKLGKGLIIVPVPRLFRCWKRVGRYEARFYGSSNQQSTRKGEDKKPWPWAGEKETMFLV